MPSGRRCVGTHHSIASKHMGLFLSLLSPVFAPPSSRCESAREPLGAESSQDDASRLGHYQSDCLCAISPTQILQYWPSHELDLGKSQSHVSTDFPPLGQGVHQVGTAPALSKAQLAARFHWPEWAEFEHGTTGSVLPHPSE